MTPSQLRAKVVAERVAWIRRMLADLQGVPVQFLPAFNPLIKEAVAEARDTTFEQTPTRVLRAEHLVAIMLQTGRSKDRERLASFVAEVPLNEAYLAGVLERHSLAAKWQEWRGMS